MLPRHVGRRHEFGQVREQEAGKSAEAAGDDIGDEPETLHVEANGGHTDGVLLAAAQHAAEAGADQCAAKQISRQQAEQGEIIECAVVLQERPARNGAARRNGEAVVAAVRRKRRGDEIGHLPEGERDHNEISAAGAQANNAGQPGKQHRDRDGDRQRDQPFADAVGREDADRVGSKPDEGGVAERDQPGITDEKVERDRGDREHHHAAADIDQILPRRQRSDDRQEREDDENQRR